MRVLACDPGIGGSGLAYSSGGEELPVADCITAPSKLSPQKKAEYIAWVVRKWITLYNVQLVVCEDMQFEDSERGRIAAKKGDMLKTEFLVGAIGGICLERGIRFELIRVIDWKGQTPKDLIEDRICRDLGCAHGTYKSHAIDAVGIVNYARKRFAAEG